MTDTVAPDAPWRASEAARDPKNRGPLLERLWQQTMATAPGSHVVITGECGMGEKGDVVPCTNFAPGTDFDRLMHLGAVRAATPEEVNLRHVTLPADDGASKSPVEMQLQAEKQRREELERKLLAERDRSRQLESRDQHHLASLGQFNPLAMQQKDEAIEGLRTQLAAMQAERDRLQHEADALKQSQKPAETSSLKPQQKRG